VNPNPVLQKLGFSNNERVVIVHTDDIGMCQASVTAFRQLWEVGIISSGSTMVPCSWFLEAAKFARETPDMDLGIHTTLTCEWETYRWGPISTANLDSGLIDPEGYFYRTVEDARKHGNPDAVRAEIQAQIERALSNGISATHLDTHMGTIATEAYIPAYIQLALQYGLPPMILRLDRDGFLEMGMNEVSADFAVNMITQLEADGIPLLDHLSGLELDHAVSKQDRFAYTKKVLSALKPGITHFIIHPSVDTPELRAITPDWQYRVADYETFRSDELKKYIQNLGIQVIGYRALQKLMV
jgi:predicted glycoside hydrolase/deacetylase ChbG (UPF0249 family)